MNINLQYLSSTNRIENSAKNEFRSKKDQTFENSKIKKTDTEVNSLDFSKILDVEISKL